MADSNINISGGAYPSDDKPEKKKKKKPDLPIVPIKNAADYQRMKLERLFANPEKPVVIPVRPRDKNLPPPPEFVRNVMGSSAGAGSGEFHVYRHLRRKEYARQKTIVEKAKVEELDDDFQKKLEENKNLAESKTAKKRAKRMKKKQNLKKKKGGNSTDGKSNAKGERCSSGSDPTNSSEGSDEDTETAVKTGNKNGNKQSAGQKNGSNNAQRQITSSNNLKTLSLSQPTGSMGSDSSSDD